MYPKIASKLTLVFSSLQLHASPFLLFSDDVDVFPPSFVLLLDDASVVESLLEFHPQYPQAIHYTHG